jgi:hypothetical protein
MRVWERSAIRGTRSHGDDEAPAVDVEALDGGHLLALRPADPAELVRRAFRNAAGAAELARTVDLFLRAD